MPRKRNKVNEGPPPNLYRRKNIYYYRDPRTKIEYSVGKNRSLAITEAIHGNITILKPKVSLLDRINNIKVITLHEWLDDYQKILCNRNLKPKSLNDYSSRIKIIKSKFKDNNIDLIMPKDIHEFISSYEKPTMAKLLRSTLSDAFNEAIAHGIVDKNPVSVTRSPKTTVQRTRLSLEQFNKIICNCDNRYRNIFLLSLLTGQRIGDIVNMKWSDIYDNKLHVTQSKTGSKIAIPLSLKLDAVKISIIEVINKMKVNPVYICGVTINS